MKNKPHIRMLSGFWVCARRDVTGYKIFGDLFLPPFNEGVGYSKAGPHIAYEKWEKQSGYFLKQAGPISHVSDDDSTDMEKAQISNRFVKSCGWLLLLFFPIIIVLYWFAGGQF